MPETSPVLLVARGVLIEALRRKDAYILGMLAGMFCLAVVVARLAGIEDPAAATFLLNLGMSLAFFCASVLTLLTAVRQVPSELENRTIHPMLAKPLSRREYLLGKWSASAAIGIAAMLALWAVAWFPVPRMEPFDNYLLAQALAAKGVALAALAALGILFSVSMPKGVAIVSLALLYFGGGTAAQLLRAKSFRTPLQPLAEWGTRYIPDFDLLDLTKRYTDLAGFVPGPEFVGVLAYGAVVTAAALAAACLLFERKRL